MEGHASQEQLERFRDRLLSPPALLEVDSHLASCPLCREALRERTAGTPSGMLAAVRAAPKQHLTYEQLEGLVDNSLILEEKEAAEIHLLSCDECRGELQDLRGFDAVLTQQTTAVGRAAAQAHSIGDWLRVLVPSPQFASALAGIVVVIALGFWLSGTRQPSGSDRPRLTASLLNGLAEGPSDVVSAERVGRLRDILQGRRVESGGLPRPLSAPQSPSLLEPSLEGVADLSPLLKWKTTSAPPFRVVVFNSRGEAVVESPALSEREWRISVPLSLGEVYEWQVSGSEGTIARTTIRSLGEEEARFWLWLDQQHATHPLLLGAAALDLGMLSEAERRLEQAIAENQEPAIAQRLQSNVQALRAAQR